MEEDTGVKAPVTRLRRRLSIEQSEESKSPAVNTPTKKKTRKKPELELIDENTPENTTPHIINKGVIKDTIDPVEDKPMTPSRRSTRIKSNTSIVSETAVAIGSPRAKRATRRASQVGSDSEASVTPVRKTRRNVKDSASSIEKVNQPTAKPAKQITEVIIEEPEISSSRTKKSQIEMNQHKQSTEASRKSPRLIQKQNTNKPNSPQKTAISIEEVSDKQISDSIQTQNQKDRLSISSSKLIKDLDTDGKVKKNKINLNKSTSHVVNQNDAKINIKRARSWTTLSEAKEKIFFSDNESAKKKIKLPLILNNSASQDIQNISLDQNNSKKNKINKSLIDENINKSLNVESNISKEINKNENARNENDFNTSSLFEKEPSKDIKTVVVIDDSDSNSAKANVQDTNDNGDQCVPVIENPGTLGINQFTLISDNHIILNKSKNRTITNDSCEPMDVDETMPDSMVIAETESKEQDSNRISLVGNEDDLNVSNSQNSNKSKANLDKSMIENKSTVILSCKETPVSSPKIVNKLLSKSAVDFDVTLENESNKKNISLNCLTTSTPLQHKTLQKLLIQVNTSMITSNIDDKHVISNLENTSKNHDNFIINKSNLSNKEDNSKLENEKMDVSESMKDKSNKEQQMKLNLSSEQTNEKSKDNELNESEDSDEDVPMKKPIKQSKPNNKISSISSNDSDEEDEISEDQSRVSNIFDDEAEDMGDDYESGDSRDESEKQFERENEIRERGETLTSENDLSNDSDYEKDSFIVSSDEEDNELLEGTENDLSMSDNELKMTSKSKKKYDDRKLKEQKIASREMYESRHKINQRPDKIKKNNRQKLSSSESESSESEKESDKVKKNNRMRLDSSEEASFVEGDNNKSITKKKSPRLSETICDDVVNEKEITVINESIKENDPSYQIKEESKTPIKSANSTIAFIDSVETNNDKNESTKTQTELMDPLEASMDDDVSLSSENEEIMQNYDSILNDLNKSNKVKTKTCDISLNIDNKSKKKEKTTIVDELNLTQVKSIKKAKNKPLAKVKAQKEEKIPKDGEESSDSIDIHLLFSEDSNDSDKIKNKNNESNIEDNFIPLKRTEAKSNIREDEDSNKQTANMSLNHSAKKNKKRKSQIDKMTSSDPTEDNNLSFFIDTEGTRNDTLNNSHNKSLKKNMSINNVDVDFDESPTQEEISIHKQKTQLINETDSSTNKILNKSVTKTPGSAKKKPPYNIKVDTVVSDNSDSDAPMEVSYKKEKREAKIKDNLEVENHDSDFVLNKSLNKSLIKTPTSERKKKANKKYLEDNENLDISANISLIKTPRSERKTLDEDIVQIENADNVTFIEKSFNKSIDKTPVSENKKKKSLSLINNNEEIGDIVATETVLNTSIDIKKKKKSLLAESGDESENKNLIKTPNSGKKKKKKLSESSQFVDKNDLNPDLSLNKSMTKTPNTDTKKKISITLVNQSEEESVEAGLNVSKIKTPDSKKKNIAEQEEDPENDDTNSKKRKRKSSVSNAVEETVAKGGVCLLNESLVINQKKKRKISQQETTEEDKNKKQMVGNNQFAYNIDIPKRRKSKKRKERDDDDDDDDEENYVSKASKQNSYKTPILRLPTSLLKQLDDKPQLKKHQPQYKKPKLISTSQFVVEETVKRKAKPSNYLEESIYINDDDEECDDKKSKRCIINPKVLPFVPTASISNSGCTTNFKVNIVPKETKFIAQSNSIDNFKDDYLYNKKIRRQGTYELYKRNRNLKISKF